MSHNSILNLMTRTAILVCIFGLFVFIPAGTFNWLEAWICLIIVLIIFEAMVIYFWTHDRALIQSRGSFNKPKERWDLFLYLFFMISLFTELIIAGLDYRFEITYVSDTIRYLSFCLIIIGLLTYFSVMRENKYLSKIVEVQRDQQVISTGPYKIVRHPLYLGNSILVIGLSLSLGSLIALIPALCIILIMTIRLLFEEKKLSEELQGYSDYKKKVRFRLIPYIW